MDLFLLRRRKSTAECTQELKFSKSYVDEIVCTVNGNFRQFSGFDYVEYSNSLNKNTKFSIETPNTNADLGLLYLSWNLRLTDEKK